LYALVYARRCSKRPEAISMNSESEPSPTVVSGRSESGRFAPGNSFARGNPHAQRVGALRSALLDAVTEDDVREVLAALIREAKDGNVAAMREFFSRVLGQPEAVDILNRMSELEALLEHAAAEATR